MHFRYSILLVGLIGCEPMAESLEVLPETGHWSYETTKITFSNCPDIAETETVRPQIENLWVAPAGPGFMLGHDHGEFGSCSRDGASFDCHPSMDMDWSNPERKLTATLTADGELDSAASMDGSFELVYSCFGSECTDLQLPEQGECRILGTFTAFSDPR